MDCCVFPSFHHLSYHFHDIYFHPCLCGVGPAGQAHEDDPTTNRPPPVPQHYFHGTVVNTPVASLRHYLVYENGYASAYFQTFLCQITKSKPSRYILSNLAATSPTRACQNRQCTKGHSPIKDPSSELWKPTSFGPTCFLYAVSSGRSAARSVSDQSFPLCNVLFIIASCNFLLIAIPAATQVCR